MKLAIWINTYEKNRRKFLQQKSSFSASQVPDFIVGLRVGRDDNTIFATDATVRIRIFPGSEKWIFPNVSTTTSVGGPILADVAGPPSPEKPATNVPATTVTRPVLFVTFKIAPSWTQAKNMFPAASREMPLV